MIGIKGTTEQPSTFAEQNPEGTFGYTGTEDNSMAGYNPAGTTATNQMAGYSSYMASKASQRTQSYSPHMAPAQEIINETEETNTEEENDDESTVQLDNTPTTPAQKFANIFGYNPEAPGGTHFGPTFLHDTDAAGLGCSICHLGTIDKDGNLDYCSGILTELPEFSFSINYEDGPGKTTLNFISQLFDSDLFKITNALGSADNTFKNLISTGTMSKSMYNGTSFSDINLKFRLYTNDLMGQSSIINWKRLLSNYAVIDSSNNLTIENGCSNIYSGLKNAAGIGNDIIKLFNNNEIAEKEEEEKKDEPQDPQKVDKEVYKLLGAFLTKLKDTLCTGTTGYTQTESFKPSVTYNFCTDDKQDYHVILISIEYVLKKNMENQSAVDKFTDWFTGVLKSYATVLTGEGYGDYTNPSETISIKTSFCSIIYAYDTTESNAGVPTSKIFSQLSANMKKLESAGKITELNAWNLKKSSLFTNSETVKNDFEDLKNADQQIGITNTADLVKTLVFLDAGKKDNFINVEELMNNYKKFLSELETKWAALFAEEPPTPVEQDAKEYEDDITKVQNFYNGLKAASNGLQEILETRFSYYRAVQGFNKTNSLGEKLFILKIYSPFLFKNLLTVSVKNWEITPSKELNYYYDISITCGLDQVYSINQWNNVLTDLTQFYTDNKLL